MLIKRQTDRQPTDIGGEVEKVAREEAKREKLIRMESTDTMSSARRAPTLGLPDDPEAEIDDIVAEVKKEIEERRRRGSLVQGFDVRKAVEEKLEEFQKKH
jgi:lysophospholipid acyltransferase